MVNKDISTNGLAKLLSFEFVVGAAGLLFTFGTIYSTLGQGIESNTKTNTRQDAQIALLLETQQQLREDSAAARQSDLFQSANQDMMRKDITRILDILESRRPN